MGLTLPGLLGRVFAAASEWFASLRIAGKTYPNMIMFGDGRLYLSTGDEDLTASNLVYMPPDIYVKAKSGRMAMCLRGNADGVIGEIFEIADNMGAPIFWVSNVGGMGINDNIRTFYNLLAGPPMFETDIYGHLMLGGNTAMRFTPGPVANIMSWVDAVGEVYQRGRGPTQGGWTATNASYGGKAYGGFTRAVNGYTWVRQWTATAGGPVVTITGTGTAGYPVPPGKFIAGCLSTFSDTAARAKTLALVFYDATGAVTGTTVSAAAVTDSISQWTKLTVQAVAPPAARYAALQLTIAGCGAGEQHEDTCAGLYPNLTAGDITAWSPPFIYWMEAFGGVDVLGRNDGAKVGDIIVRTDGPGNVVQRFWTCVKAGRPWEQVWSSDPRLTSQPSRLNWYGGTYLLQGASANADYVLPSVAGGMLHNDMLDSLNRGVTNARLMDDAAAAGKTGGVSQFLQSVRKKNTGQPYVSKDGVFCFFWGPWDLGYVTAAQGSAVMGRVTGYSAVPGAGASVVNTLRYCIRHARASVILPYTNAAFVLNGGANSGVVPYAYSGGAAGVGGTFRNYTTTSTGWTFTIPADFEGGAVSIGLIGASGAFGGTVTWSGSCPGASGTTYVSTTSDVGFRSRVVRTFGGLDATAAGKTIIGTVTQVDASGGIGLDAALIEGPYPNLTFVFGAPRLRDNAAYVTLGNAMIGSSYWAGNAGATGDADIAALNASLASLCAEFTDGLAVYVDIDSAIQKYANFFYTGDGIRLDESGVHAMAQEFVTTLNAALPAIDFRNVNHDYHDTTAGVIGTFTKAGTLAVLTGTTRLYIDDQWQVTAVRIGVGTAPTGATAIVDVSKNGVTLFTTQANRPAIAISAFTALSPAPDVWALAPGDYLTADIDQVGSTVAGADLTVTVYGRKIPIP